MEYYDASNFGVLDNPFFSSCGQQSNNYLIEKNTPDKQYTNDNMQWLVYNYSVPIKFIEMYEKLKSTTEIKIGDFTLFALEKIKKIAENYQSYNQTDYIDIGVTYAGMGHVQLLSWHWGINKCFYRYDGGSNGYEREHYFRYHIENCKLVYDTPIHEDATLNIKKTGFCIGDINERFDFDEFVNTQLPKTKDELADTS